MPRPALSADDSRRALADAGRHQSANDAAASIEAEVRYGLQTFDDSFADALGGDFLAASDPAELKRRYSGAELGRRLLGLQRTLAAQRALQSLYARLQSGTTLSPEERALAEHAGDLCELHVERETRRRCERAGL